ncbi:MAG: RluA family pseudouridine synthase [Candidatus Nanopelagicales bacterium]
MSRAYPVPDGLIGERIDVALARMLGMSRARVGALVDAGLVTVDDKVIAKSHRLAADDVIEVDEPSPAAAVVEPVSDMPILFEDEDVIVIDKPVGVAAHPSPGWTGPTVTGSLAAAGHVLASVGASEREGIVHRLDVGTTGAMVLAKSPRAYTSLKQQFKDRSVTKEYHAIVHGLLDPLEGTIDAPIDRHPTKDYKWAVVHSGRPSITHYRTLEAWPRASLVEVHLETGRTHQIRVHMAAMRHPCIGDVTYGADPTMARELGLERQWLHARRLGFHHPGTGQWLEVESPYPDDLRESLHTLQSGLST